jgi:D-alanyl-D-alanine carboxypeptidase
MTKRILNFCFKVIFFTAMLSLFSFDGGISAGNAALQTLLLDNWAQYKYPANAGGFSAIVITPKGEYFASCISGMTPATHFRPSSVTKIATAAGFLLLEQRGLVKLDDPITAMLPGTTTPYLPDSKEWSIPNKDAITPRMLLQHYSGLFDLVNDPIPKSVDATYKGLSYIDWILMSESDRTVSPQEQASIISKYGLSFAKPGTEYHYSNTGYSFVAEIIERASGKPFEKFLNEELFAPLGLFETSFVVEGTDQRLPEPFLQGCNKQGNAYKDVTHRDVSPGIGSYNMVTTLHDLALFIRALLDGQTVVRPDTVMKMFDFKPSDMRGIGYGLGLMNSPPELGFGLNGNMKGFQTIARSDPDKDITVIVVSSLTDSDNPTKILPVLRKTAIEARKLLGE